MDNLQEAHEKINLARTILTGQIDYFEEKIRSLRSLGFDQFSDELGTVVKDLHFLVEDLSKAIHLAITHNIKN